MERCFSLPDQTIRPHFWPSLLLLFTSAMPSIFPNLESMVVQSSWGVLPVRKYSDHVRTVVVMVHAVGGRKDYLPAPSFRNFYSVRENPLYICVCTSPSHPRQHFPSSLRGNLSSLRANNKATGWVSWATIGVTAVHCDLFVQMIYLLPRHCDAWICAKGLQLKHKGARGCVLEGIFSY